jgi:hypothetical protein
MNLLRCQLATVTTNTVTEPPEKAGVYLLRSYQRILNEMRIYKHNT